MKRYRRILYYYKKLVMVAAFCIFISFCLYYQVSRNKGLTRGNSYAHIDYNTLDYNTTLDDEFYSNETENQNVSVVGNYSLVWNLEEWIEFRSHLKVKDRRYVVPVTAPSLNFIDNDGLECRNKGKRLKLLMGVKSAPSNFQSRSDVRQTWGGKALKLGVKLLFIVGGSDLATNERVRSERKTHSDIIFCDFQDAYYNLTVKSMMFYKWTVNYCPYVKHIAKLDDDSMVNIPRLLGNLKSVGPRSVAGYLWKSPEVSRSTKHKYFLPKDIYPWKYHPNFISGGFIVVGIEAVRVIYEKSQNVPYFNLDDVYETGMLNAVAKLKFIDWRNFVTPYAGNDLHNQIAFTNRPRKRFILMWRRLIRTSIREQYW